MVHEFFDTVTVSPLQKEQTLAAHEEEGTSTQWGNVAQIDWGQMMVFDPAGLAFWSNYNKEVHAADQLLWNSYTRSQLTMVAGLVTIKEEIDMDYCKFCGEVRYKPTRERNLNRKMTSYVILSPSNPKCLIDVYLEPLIEELQNLWHVEQESITKNRVEKNAVNPRLTGEEIHDWVVEFSPTVKEPLKLPPGCGSEHKWTKKSIFWELKYWETHLIQHNLDVMHIQKNVFDNIFNIVMDIKGKSKDNLNAWKILKIIYNRPEFEVDERRPNVMHKSLYTLTKTRRGGCVNGFIF
ncbi:hypothetical protein Sango_1594700 [Sesamum angolense]|uniref:Transposase n=1 Tax=Sesamum angolense TaxID=2727404 RepID=A0AAE2BTV8_9LAMI|nr:hypothetical protein Sango_1594700 [Sesamum angolense]